MRDKKISADISKEANALLNDLVNKHERSKGWLLDKMIRKFCETETFPVKKEIKPRGKAFKPPTVEEVFNYCNERCNNVDAQAFIDHYTANGWVQGKNKPIKCWKAAIRTWERSDKPKQSDVLNQSHEGQW